MSLKEMDQKILFNWLRKLLYGLFFAKSKIFRLHAISHDVAGPGKSTTHKGPGYCYSLPKFPSPCFLCHVSGMFFCLYLEIFASTIYALIDC